MNNFIKSLSFAAFVTVSSMSGAANAQKLAVVDVQQVLQSLPQVAVIEQNIQAEFASQMQEVQRLRSDGNFLVEKLQRERATMSEVAITDLEGQINVLGQQLQQKGQPLQQDVERRTEEERRKLFALIQQAIDSIAEKENYDMVLNSNAVPFSDKKFDISEKVQQQVSRAN